MADSPFPGGAVLSSIPFGNMPLETAVSFLGGGWSTETQLVFHPDFDRRSRSIPAHLIVGRDRCPGCGGSRSRQQEEGDA